VCVCVYPTHKLYALSYDYFNLYFSSKKRTRVLFRLDSKKVSSRISLRKVFQIVKILSWLLLHLFFMGAVK